MVLMEVPPRTLAKRKKVDEVKPVSGLDIEALLRKGGAGKSESSPSKRRKLEGSIGSDDPAKDFKQLIDNEENSWKSGQCLLSVAYASFQRNGDGY